MATEETSHVSEVRHEVRRQYAQAAAIVLEGRGAACCATGNVGTGKSAQENDVITRNHYDSIQTGELPESAVLASLGCGNPTALAELALGEHVLDLGSGGGIDVLLSARRVGPTGFAYGLDMTDEMLQLAERNRAEAGAENVRFVKGHIEDIPLQDGIVDVIISNCVINLSGDKQQVLREAFRVLKPGGRFAVSDVVLERELPDAVRSDMAAYVGCVAGALLKDEYQRQLEEAGFHNVSFEVTRRYTFEDLQGSSCCSANVNALGGEARAAMDGGVMACFIRAAKPAHSTA